MRKQQARLICAAVLAAGLATLGLAGTTLGRIGKTRPFSFMASVSAKNSPADQLIHISGVIGNQKVSSAGGKPFEGFRSIPPEAASTRSEDSRNNKFYGHIQLTDCLA